MLFHKNFAAACGELAPLGTTGLELWFQTAFYIFCLYVKVKFPQTKKRKELKTGSLQENYLSPIKVQR